MDFLSPFFYERMDQSMEKTEVVLATLFLVLIYNKDKEILIFLG